MRFHRSFFLNPTLEVARQLMGAHLTSVVRGRAVTGRIIEVEAYHQSEPASHSFCGETKRNQLMFGLGGYAYVYFIYGMHFCVNVVTESAGIGAAVLIRAVAPLEGLEHMQRRRGAVAPFNLCNGPAKLTQAFGIDKSFQGEDFVRSDRLYLEHGTAVRKSEIVSTTRIGISKAVELPWRFVFRH